MSVSISIANTVVVRETDHYRFVLDLQIGAGGIYGYYGVVFRVAADGTLLNDIESAKGLLNSAIVISSSKMDLWKMAAPKALEYAKCLQADFGTYTFPEKDVTKAIRVADSEKQVINNEADELARKGAIDRALDARDEALFNKLIKGEK